MKNLIVNENNKFLSKETRIEAYKKLNQLENEYEEILASLKAEIGDLKDVAKVYILEDNDWYC